jgi:hypothetical protein
MTQNTLQSLAFRRHIALPQDHGSWVFIFSPLLIGLFTGGSWSAATGFLILGAIAAFLIRQPITIITKALSGRRSGQQAARELPAAYFWVAVYASLLAISTAGLVLLGFGYVLLLAIPGLPVFAWHLLLVSRRAERRQIGVEIVGVGVLALAAPAAYWVGVGAPAVTGLWLWLLVWFQSAASIVYAYQRLEQRTLKVYPDLRTCLSMGRRSLIYTSFNLGAVSLLSAYQVLPLLLPLAYLIQWIESIWGTIFPAVGYKPTRIGIRQLIVSCLYTLVFILVWNLGI